MNQGETKMSKIARIPPPDLVLAIDLGGSKTKAIAVAYASGAKPVLLCMEPEVADVSYASLQDYEQNKSGTSEPEDTCWIGVGDDYHAVGFLAQHKYGGNSLLKQLKEASAIPKICGALWVLREKLGLDNKLKVALTVLLPPSEYQDKESLLVKLTSALECFRTPTGEMRVKLLLFDAKSEGAGMYLHRRAVLGDDINNRALAIAMVGYRNASVLMSVRGTVSPGLTSEFGMAWMVDAFVRRTSGLHKEDPRLIPAIVEAGASCLHEPLTRLVRKKNPLEIEAEAIRMAEALKLSRDDYFRALVRWLSQQIPVDIDEIIFCGGTAEYLKEELVAHWSHTYVIWNGGIEIPPQLDTAGMGSRIGDVLALYKAFITRINLLQNRKQTSNADESTSNKSFPVDQQHKLLVGAVHSKERKKPKGFLDMPEKL